MSLINQMLQELEARRSEVTGTDMYGQQIRAVPGRRRIHPAWWVALALGIALSGLLAWLVLRPPVSDPARNPGQQLPLKLDIDLNATPAMRQNPPPQAPQPAVVANAIPEAAVEAPILRPPPVQAVPAPAVKEAPAAPVPELAKVVVAAKPLVADSVSKQPEAVAPVVISKQVKELTPQQRAENEYRKSIQSLQQGKSVEAASGLERTLHLDPQHAAARQTLIGLLLESKRQDEAVRMAREGLGIDPAQPGLAMILARLQIEKGELRAAIETLERTLPYAAERAEYHAFLAALLQRDERHKQAAERYLLALQRAPQNGVWWMGLGISLQAEQRTNEAQEAFRRAKATNSLSPELLAFVEARLNQLQR